MTCSLASLGLTTIPFIVFIPQLLPKSIWSPLGAWIVEYPENLCTGMLLFFLSSQSKRLKKTDLLLPPVLLTPWILDLPKGQQLEILLICTVGCVQAFLAMLNRRELLLQSLLYLETLMLLYAPLFELPWFFGCTAIPWLAKGLPVDMRSAHSIALMLSTLLVLGMPRKERSVNNLRKQPHDD